MKNVANTIEDLLEILAGLREQAQMQIESSDATIMLSIARQTFKGTALTDRQFALMQEKLQYYRDQFTALDYEFDRAVDTLRQPLRHIDRSKYIKLVSHNEMVGDNLYESYKQDWKWIKVRFPFAKKLIMIVNELQSNNGDYHHEKGTHEHYFRLTERNAYNVIDKFKDKNFEIEKYLLDLYKELCELEVNKDQYVPGVYNGKIKNLPDNAIFAIENSVEDNSILQYYDRRHLFGLKHFDDIEQVLNRATPLSASIAKRKSNRVVIKPSTHNINNLLSSLKELNRFPLLVILDETEALDKLSEIHYSLRNMFRSEDMSVMFRLGNSDGADFNIFVKENNLNNMVAKNTKVVYINNNKVPKPLINSGWRPSTSLRFDTDYFKQAGKYVEGLDLNIDYIEEAGYFGRYGLGRRYEII